MYYVYIFSTWHIHFICGETHNEHARYVFRILEF